MIAKAAVLEGLQRFSRGGFKKVVDKTKTHRKYVEDVVPAIKISTLRVHPNCTHVS